MTLATYLKKVRRERCKMKKLFLGCVVASSLAIPSLALAANPDEGVETSTNKEVTIPAFMEPGTVIKFNNQEESVILREGDKNASLTHQYSLQVDETDLPVIKPGMTVVYDALGAPIVVIPESRESINVEMEEIGTEVNPLTVAVPYASTQSGTISWFDIWAESDTASGLKAADGAAHKTIPFKTSVSVKSTENSKTATVRILDRGPYVTGRILDMSKESFGKIHATTKGLFSGTITY